MRTNVTLGTQTTFKIRREPRISEVGEAGHVGASSISTVARTVVTTETTIGRSRQTFSGTIHTRITEDARVFSILLRKRIVSTIGARRANRVLRHITN